MTTKVKALRAGHSSNSFRQKPANEHTERERASYDTCVSLTVGGGRAFYLDDIVDVAAYRGLAQEPAEHRPGEGFPFVVDDAWCLMVAMLLLMRHAHLKIRADHAFWVTG